MRFPKPSVIFEAIQGAIKYRNLLTPSDIILKKNSYVISHMTKKTLLENSSYPVVFIKNNIHIYIYI